MNRKRRNNKDAIDWIEFNNEATKLDSDFQYLKTENKTDFILLLVWWTTPEKLRKSPFTDRLNSTYFVTLKTLRRRTHRNTDIPIGGIVSVFTNTISTILLIVAKQSNRLNSDTKYRCM